MTQRLNLIDGASQCLVCPTLGGSIASWSVDGQAMLREASKAAIGVGDPLQLSSFPLVPYSNRIGFATFDWNGRTIGIQPNFPPEPHAVHGVGWMRPWQVETVTRSACTLRLDHEADGHWPWSFAATQTITLANNSMTLNLRITNMSDEAAPMGFGHHPYFDQAGASLTFVAKHVYTVDADCLPEHAVSPEGQFDFSRGGAVAVRDVDHCFAGWQNEAHIMWDKRPHALDITSDMSCAVVYIPKGGDAFCFEPVPHINNAVNRVDDEPMMARLNPGEHFKAMIRMQARRVG